MKKIDHPLYQVWRGMMKRCYNENATGYHNYGGRGIKVCPRWHNFWNFAKDLQPRSTKKHTLDRYPNHDGDYEPNNVRWATKKQQRINTQFHHKKLTINNQTKLVSEWCRQFGIPRLLFERRVREKGWSIQRALHTRLMPKRPNNSVLPSGIFVKCQKLGINYQSVKSRVLQRGWSLRRAINTPMRGASAC
jgi:hypothetical protein